MGRRYQKILPERPASLHVSRSRFIHFGLKMEPFVLSVARELFDSREYLFICGADVVAILNGMCFARSYSCGYRILMILSWNYFLSIRINGDFRKSQVLD